MEIEKRNTSFQICFERGKDKQKLSVVGVSDEKDIVALIRNTFKGRFKRPVALSPKDGVKIVIKKFDHLRNQVSLVMNTRIYNKSPRNARIDFEKSITTIKI